MNKQTLANMFGIETHEEDVRRMNMENESLAQQVARLQVRNDQLHEELAFYKLSDENKIKVMSKDIEELEQTYKARIREYEELAARCDKIIDDIEQIGHREFARGRQAAYSEMGIWRLDALDAGNHLVMDKNGDVYELLEDLEDVKASDDAVVNTVSTSEIEIDDLTEEKHKELQELAKIYYT